MYFLVHKSASILSAASLRFSLGVLRPPGSGVLESGALLLGGCEFHIFIFAEVVQPIVCHILLYIQFILKMHPAISLLGKSYDFRVIYPTIIDRSFYELIGRAWATWAPKGTIIVGGDARLSTPELKSAMIAGLISSGRRVLDLGLVSSDMLQFASIHLASECAMAIMITASHNPKEYNGFKCCLANAAPINLQIVAPELKHIIEIGNFINEVGSEETYDILPAWIKRVSKFAPSDLGALRVVADAGN